MRFWPRLGSISFLWISLRGDWHWLRVSLTRGMGHGGTLNFGDAFSYALARSRDAPLLFVGNDFFATDISAALPP